jgi:integrase/recombinase XerD
MGTNAWAEGDGPLVPFAEGFRNVLLERHYSRSAVNEHVRWMGRLSLWLASRGLRARDLTVGRTEAFLVAQRVGGQRRVPTLGTLKVLLAYLTDQQVMPVETPKAPSPGEQLLVRYRRHLVHDRGLTPTTVLRYERFARRFLAGRASRAGDEVGLDGLVSAEIHAFLLESTCRLVQESAKREAADLRSLLRFLYVEGILATDLGSAMPPIATWRGTRLPAGLAATDVDALLSNCDRATPSGRRDYAILSLLARLGLRSGEVAALRLGDVDWRSGQILVRGKARRQDWLPLPVQVGEALVAYLRHGRPQSESAQLFLTLLAPPRPIHPSSITRVVYRACRRAGVGRVGAHRLRHALATEMLNRGGSLIEIAQVLRQSDLATTSGYAKVDRTALRSVAQAWPGAGR